MTEVKEDRRVRRTKKLLLQGLTQLMQQKQLKDITVRELSDLVDINRGTFYLYYRDIFDMLEQVEQNLFDKFDQILESHSNDTIIHQTRPFLNDLFAFIQENKAMCRVLLGQNGDIAFLQRLNKLLRDKCRTEAPGNSNDFDYRYSFVVFGCIGLIHTWLENDCADKPEDMALLADRMIHIG